MALSVYIKDMLSRVRNIGAVFDKQVKMKIQFIQTCTDTCLQLYKSSQVREYLTAK